MSKAQAAVLTRLSDGPTVCEIEVAAPKHGEVLVRMVAAGVCQSDLHVLTGHRSSPLPVVLGHEGAGIVLAVGPEVNSVKVGDHVILLWRLSCGGCPYCLGGRPSLCDSGREMRRTGQLLDGTTRFSRDGMSLGHFAGVSTFSELTVVPERAALPIPHDIPLELAALLGCAVTTGVGAVINAARVRQGSSVAVFGVGGVGLNVVQGARLAGAQTIIAIDQHEAKLDLAEHFGATAVVDATKEDVVARIREISGGSGVDYAFEVVGLPSLVKDAYDALGKRGLLVVVGIAQPDASFAVPLLTLVQDERSILGSLYGSGDPRLDIPRLIQLYRDHRIDLESLLTRTYRLNEIAAAFDALRRGEVARSVVTFEATNGGSGAS